jgi:hypothetical protein
MFPSLRSLRGEFAGGVASAIPGLAHALTLGLLAFAPLGPEHAGIGIRAGFAAGIFGGIAATVRSGTPLPATGARFHQPDPRRIRRHPRRRPRPRRGGRVRARDPVRRGLGRAPDPVRRAASGVARQVRSLPGARRVHDRRGDPRAVAGSACPRPGAGRAAATRARMACGGRAADRVGRHRDRGDHLGRGLALEGRPGRARRARRGNCGLLRDLVCRTGRWRSLRTAS